MRRPEFVARQARCPTGLLGALLTRIMARETALENDVALELLELQPTDHVLEIGFGHGRTLERAAERLPRGFAAGIDVSEQVVRTVARRNRRLIHARRLEVQQADSRRIPYPDACFDKAYALHTLYFWADPAADLGEIQRVVKPGGRFVLGFRPQSDANAVADLPSTVYRFYSPSEVERVLQRAGFGTVQLEGRHVNAKTVVFAIGRRE